MVSQIFWQINDLTWPGKNILTFYIFWPNVSIYRKRVGLVFKSDWKKQTCALPSLVVTHPCSWSTLSAGLHGPAAGSRCQQRDEACWIPRRLSVHWGPRCSTSTENPETATQVSHALNVFKLEMPGYLTFTEVNLNVVILSCHSK